MQYLDVHGKRLPVPSFFQVYNYGGGFGDKDREIVYAHLTGDTPALVNYYYISNRYPNRFRSALFDYGLEYASPGDLYNHIRETLIRRGEVCRGHTPPPYDFNQKVFLLDSGAFNIVKALAEETGYCGSAVLARLREEAWAYYDFAGRLGFDLVAGFDLGGKYTEKDGEKYNRKLSALLDSMNSREANEVLLQETVSYLKAHPGYRPHVLATVHGDTPEEYEASVRHILVLERESGVRFWGFALGGIANYRRVQDVWYGDVDFRSTGKRGLQEIVAPARASRIVRALAGGRPIHALGCGGYNNIAPLSFSGAPSFDAASPVRRVGDGSLASTKQVFDPRPSRESFSKYFMGGINRDGTLRPEEPGYRKLNEVPDSLPLCGCAACRAAGSIRRIKELYAQKEQDDEANYYSRQLMGLHAVLQHRRLCGTVARFDTMEAFCRAYPSRLNRNLLQVFRQL